jgi:hypothetical protein
MDCCVQGSICFEMMKGVPAAFVTLIIGAIAGLITWRQYQVAKAKLKLDLFQKRYDIFHKTWVTLSDAVLRGTHEDHHGMATPFNNFLPEAAFLFGPEIAKYLDEVSTKWTELHGLGSAKNSTETTDRMMELEQWFFDQASEGAKKKFGKYLDFKNWK